MNVVATYKPLVRKSVEGAKSEPKNLAQVLADLQILPYTLKSVKQYKRRIALKHFMWSIPAWLYQLEIGSFFALLGTFLSSSLIGAVHLLVGSASWGCGLTIAVSLGTLVVNGIVLAFLVDRRFVVYKGEWERRDIGRLWSPHGMPEYAVQTAKDLLASGYPVRLFKEELCVNESEVGDPFLIAIDTDGTEYYVEVWGEPTYKKRY